MSTPMLKLIWPTTSTSYLERGAALLAGPAVRETDTTGWTTPAAVLEAHGLDATGATSVRSWPATKTGSFAAAAR
ncbi:MAG: hypothetical protein K0Q52_3401 [Microbacterium sp.]|nr:hypothetical protein [Microbacterium sp.]